MTGEEAAVWTRHGAADPVAAATMASWPGRLYRSAGLEDDSSTCIGNDGTVAGGLNNCSLLLFAGHIKGSEISSWHKKKTFNPVCQIIIYYSFMARIFTQHQLH